MKNFFIKKKPQVSIHPCSSDQIGCFYHIELFGKSCQDCVHVVPENKKDHKIQSPKSSPLDSISKT